MGRRWNYKIWIVLPGLALASYLRASPAWSLTDCSQFEYQSDVERCERRNREAEEQEDKRRQGREDEGGRRERIKTYRYIHNGFMSDVASNNDIEVTVDGSLGLNECSEMVRDVQKLVTAFKGAGLQGIKGGLTLADVRNLSLNVISMPQSNGQLFPDGSEEKSILAQVEDYLAAKSDMKVWTERWNQVTGIQSRFNVSKSRLDVPAPKIERMLPVTEEERESYENYLFPLRRVLGQYRGHEWSAVDSDWANKFFNDWNCENFNERFVKPYERAMPELDPTFRDYWWKLMKMTYFSRCLDNSPDSQITKRKHEAAFRQTVEQVIGGNETLFARMVMRQLNVAKIAERRLRADVIEALVTVGACVDAQVRKVNSMKPITN
jgi:hypothetical protein